MIVIRITNQWNKPFCCRGAALESNSIGSANKNSVHAKINTPTIQLLNSPFIRNRMQSEANQSSHVSSRVWGCFVGYYIPMIDEGEEEELNDGIRVN